MRVFLTAFCILLAFSFNAFGQTLTPYPPAGLIQGEIYHGPWTNPGIFNASIMYLGDTVIAPYTYSLYSNQYFGYQYTRYDSGKIYSAGRNVDRSVGQELLKYDFNLGLGDTFPLFGGGYFVVDSVSTITLLNGQVRKYIRLKDYYQENHHWVDGIGDIGRGFLYQTDFEGGYEEFLCARDNSGLLWVNSNLNMDCDSLTGYVPAFIATTLPFADFELSPSPAFDRIDLRFTGSFHSDIVIQIIDPLGQVVLKTTASSIAQQLRLDIEHLSPGIYTMRISSYSKDFIKKFLIL